MSSANRKGQVISFYSWKGGVGRSTAVANVAALLAQRGKRVLVLDFDFEAPGLHRYFLGAGPAGPGSLASPAGPGSPAGLVTAKPAQRSFEPAGPQGGVIDFFYALRERVREQWSDGKDLRDPAAMSALAEIVGGLIDAEDYIYKIRFRAPGAEGPTAHFIAAGRIDAGYADRVRSFDWQGFQASYSEVFPVFAEELCRRYDHILIDSRTGVADVGSICTMVLPSKLALVFAPNEQSLRGAVETGKLAVRQRKASADLRPLPLFPMMTHLDDSAESLRRQWVDRARAEFQALFREAYGLKQCDLAAYFNLAQVPYKSHFAYGELIAAEEAREGQAGALTAAFERFVECLELSSALDVKGVRARGPEEAGGRSRTSDAPDTEPPTRRIDEEGASVNASVAAYDEIIRRFADSKDPGFRELAAGALVNKGIELGRRSRNDEAIEAYEEVVRRFGSDADPAMREHVAAAIVNKGHRLQDAGRCEEAAAAYEEVLSRFDGASAPELKEQVERALNGAAFSLLCQAKRMWQKDDMAGALRKLEAAEARIARARESRPDDPIILGNAGYIAFLRGRRAEARALLAEAILRGGEDLRQGEFKDSYIHSLPQDEVFRALLQSL